MSATERGASSTFDRAVLVDVLVYHWPTKSSGCWCGWAVLGASFPEHVADVYEESVRARSVMGAYVLRHPTGVEYVVGSSAPDDEERMTCERAGQLGHGMCGVHECCGWPRFLLCPCVTPARTDYSTPPEAQ